jgi:hypothetical protein
MSNRNKVVLLYWQQCKACQVFRPQFQASVVPQLPPGLQVEEFEFWKHRQAVLAHAPSGNNLSFPTVVIYDANGRKHVVADDPLTPEHVLRDVRALFPRKWDFGSTHPAAIHKDAKVKSVEGGAAPLPAPVFEPVDAFAAYAVSSLSAITPPSLVLYYKPGCRYCVAFFPTFEKLGETVRNANVYAVNVSTHRGVLRTLDESVRSGAVPHLVATTASGSAHAFPQATPRTLERVLAFVDSVFKQSTPSRTPQPPRQLPAPLPAPSPSARAATTANKGRGKKNEKVSESESESESGSESENESESESSAVSGGVSSSQSASQSDEEAWSRTIKFTAGGESTAVRTRLQEGLAALQAEARKTMGKSHADLFSPSHAAVCGVAWKRARVPADDVLFVMLIPERAPASGTFPVFATLQGAPCAKKASFTIAVHNAPRAKTQTDPTKLLRRREFETAPESNVAVQALRTLGYAVRVAGGYTLPASS